MTRPPVQAILGILGALGILIVFLSSSLIANTLNALLNQHLHYIGVMKLIGARRLTIFGMYTVLIMTYGVIALLIAVPLGDQGAFYLSKLIADQMNFQLQGYRIVPLAIILQVVISLVVPLAAGFLPVNNGSRIKVQRAINSNNPADAPAQTGWLDRIGRRMHWLSRPTLLSLRNTFRRKGRLALTLFTLSMGGAIFIAVFNVQATLEQYVSSIGKYFLADVSLSFDRSYRNREVIETAHQVPGVQWVEGWAFLSAEALRPDGSVAENVQILAPPARSGLVDPILISGRWLLPGDAQSLAVSEAMLSAFPGLKPGDTLSLKISGQKETWMVVGIFKFVGRDSIVAYANYEYISQHLNIANQAYTYRIVGDQHDLASQRRLSAVLDQHFRDLGYRVNDVKPGLDTLQTASEGLGILISFLLIMALLTAVVGSIGLTGTMGINVLERTREIGIMRAIGAADRQGAEASLTAAQFELDSAQQALKDLNKYAGLSAAQAWQVLINANEQVNAAQSAYDAYDTEDYRKKIDDADVKVSDAKKVLEDAQKDFDRYQSLAEDNPTRKQYKQTLDDAQHKYNQTVEERDTLVNQKDLAKASLDTANATQVIAQQDYDNLRSGGPDPDKLALAQSRVKNAEAQVKAVQSALDNMDIKAPFTGKIVDINVKANELANPNKWAFLVADFSQLYVETNDLTELEVVNVAVGQTVTLRPDALPDLELTGEVSEISDVSTTQSGDILYKVRILLKDSEPRLRWRMTVEIEF